MGYIIIIILCVIVLICFGKIIKKQEKELDKKWNDVAEEKFHNFLRENKDLIEFQKRESERIQNLNNSLVSKNQDLAAKRRIEEENLRILKEKQQHTQELINKEKEIVDLELKSYEYERRQRIDFECEAAKRESTEKLAVKIAENDCAWKQFHDEYLNDLKRMNEEVDAVEQALSDFKSRQDRINEEIMRQRELEEKEDFYRICLTDEDIEDFQTLEKIAPKMRRSDVVPALLWSAIIQRPVNEMIKRVVGNRTGGIYKVTYIPTGESYIGRTTNFKDRFKNHCRTAIGLEAAASSTFHTHMKQNGLWNYTWTILEECPRDKQGEQEKYWIAFYETDKYGMNMKSGG